MYFTFMHFSLGSDDYLEVNIPTDLKMENSREISKRQDTEELSKTSRDTIPQAIVLPAEIPCEVSRILYYLSAPNRDWAKPTDSFGCHSWGISTGISWIEVTNAVKHRVVPTTMTSLAQKCQ